jgi:hypothetical protein
MRMFKWQVWMLLAALGIIADIGLFTFEACFAGKELSCELVSVRADPQPFRRRLARTFWRHVHDRCAEHFL